ncbi:hypothetical protein [Carnimonas bestiolae]|uniref:hypothetical protein n=1 Tax=Carnimonas bestiolae TaxID=3402172 RepID=UPI003F4AE113
MDTRRKGTPLPGHYLHVLPLLKRDPVDQVGLHDVLLNVRASWRDDSITPLEGIQMHLPYPNQCFMAGGTPRCALGWMVELPRDLTQGSVILEWRLSTPRLDGQQVAITHMFHLEFMPPDDDAQEPRIWSMDIGNYWSHSEYAKEDPKPQIARNRFSHYRTGAISPTRNATVFESEEDTVRHLTISESLTLPVLSLDECWTLRRYGGIEPSTLIELRQ